MRWKEVVRALEIKPDSEIVDLLVVYDQRRSGVKSLLFNSSADEVLANRRAYSKAKEDALVFNSQILGILSSSLGNDSKFVVTLPPEPIHPLRGLRIRGRVSDLQKVLSGPYPPFAEGVFAFATQKILVA